MIKKKWKKILIILIVAIICTGLGTYATILLDATEVSYDRE